MEIKSLVERDDGGADVSIDLTPEEHVAMVQLGLLTCIERGIEALGEQPTDLLEVVKDQIEGEAK